MCLPGSLLPLQVPALVARYAGRPGLVAAVDAAVRAQQNNDVAVEAAVGVARVLEKVVLVSEWTVPLDSYPNSTHVVVLNMPCGSQGMSVAEAFD